MCINPQNLRSCFEPQLHYHQNAEHLLKVQYSLLKVQF